ncbi:MAG: mRNA interferase MazF [Algoriphagus sp.]|jgi:mRNA interferase MazF
MKYKIVLVPFPFDDLSTTKVRPALCLTHTISAYHHVVICFITSQLFKATEVSDLRISANNPDFAETGPKVNSAVRLHRLVTIPTHLILRELGSLPDFYHNDLKEKLSRLFDL